MMPFYHDKFVCILQKDIFEFGKQMIPHSEEAVQVTQNFANYFIRSVIKALTLFIKLALLHDCILLSLIFLVMHIIL
jgi:hypothetical protein